MNSRKIIYFIRHGQSVANSDTTSSMIDPPLTQLGRLQASKLELNVDLVICSPMRRALETLHYSRLRCNEFVINNKCREKRCGHSDQMLLEIPYQETKEDFALRMTQLAQYLLDSNFNTIAVVCHGCVIASLTGEYLPNGAILIANLDTIKFIANGGTLPVLCCGYNW